MISILVLAAASFLLYRLLGGAPRLSVRRHQPVQATATKIDELTEYASRLRSVNKFNSAEKVYLQILKLDHRHSQTYSRLGTLYIAQKNYTDAIECFQIATQLSPSGTTFYNLGLAYFENQNPMKAIAALEKAIMFEPNVSRYVGLAKAFRRLGDYERVIDTLERAVEIEENPKVLWLLADAYATSEKHEQYAQAVEKIRKLNPRDPRLKGVASPTAALEKARS